MTRPLPRLSRRLESQAEKRHAKTLARSYYQRQELYSELERLIRRDLRSRTPCLVADLCCGGGDVINQLAGAYPQHQYIGVEREKTLIALATQMRDRNTQVKFERSDMFTWARRHRKSADVVIHWKTLSWMRDPVPALKALTRVARRVVWISSLFYPGWIDARVQICEWKRRGANNAERWIDYNIYSLPRIIETLSGYSDVASVRYWPFHITRRLPRPRDRDFMRTYTMESANRLLQVSGPLMMPWYILRVGLTP